MKFHKSKQALIIAFSLFLVPLTTYAFSLSNLFNFNATTSEKNKPESGRVENLQSLKVFAPEKVYAQKVEAIDSSDNISKSEQTSFETSNDFTDDLSPGGNENHSENAVYTVQKGDSIYSIASYFGVSVTTIMTFNHMDGITVHVGDVLEVPSVSGFLYTIKKGDTLSSLSKKYEVDAEDVSLYNGLISSSDLSIGDEIFLPGAKDMGTTKTKVTKKPNTVNNSKTAKNLASYIPGKWERGDTSHLNKISDVAKYMALPKFAGYYIFPAPGTTRTQKMHGHNGVDFAGKMGLSVVAAADGVVRVAKTGGYNFGYGNYIIVTHSNGTETVYAHLSKVNVSVGQSVSRGQNIALLGNSGNSTGPHLHFEIRGGYNPFAW
jgi:murein DD-endopeptidase MepM/ murein hydrolase activator NlpD